MIDWKLQGQIFFSSQIVVVLMYIHGDNPIAPNEMGMGFQISIFPISMVCSW